MKKHELQLIMNSYDRIAKEYRKESDEKDSPM
jgi:hypothetical protein